MNINNNFTSIEKVAGEYLQKNPKTNAVHTGININASFEELLLQKQQKAGELKFSKHAEERLIDRNITLSDEQMQRLEDATQKASEKGINESLVLVDDMAFIVSVKNNTVVTAMDSEQTDGNVFTNIDGAVIN